MSVLGPCVIRQISLDVSNRRPLLENLGVRTYGTASEAGVDGVVR